MTLLVKQAPVGAHMIDSLPFSQGGTAAHALALKESGVDGIAGYLGAMNQARLEHVFDAGLAFSPVTFGGEYEDGPLDEIAQLRALGIPAGTGVWLDVEGLKAFKTDPPKLIQKIKEWATPIAGEGFIPLGYFGVPQPLNSQELWELPLRGYWKGQGSQRDRSNMLAEPLKCGWMVTQMWPSYQRGGILIDSNMVGQDFKQRTFGWVVRP